MNHDTDPQRSLQRVLGGGALELYATNVLPPILQVKCPLSGFQRGGEQWTMTKKATTTLTLVLMGDRGGG